VVDRAIGEAIAAASKLLNEVKAEEKKHWKSFTSGKNSPLILAVRDNQAILRWMLAWGATKPVDTASPGRRAVAALAGGAWRLARAAYVLIASGYPFQAFVCLRGAYERLACTLAVRKDASLAQKWLDLLVKDADLPKYATVLKEGTTSLLDEYVEQVRGVQDWSRLPLELVATISRWYGMLSDYAHPKMDAAPVQFFPAATAQMDLFFIGPDAWRTPAEAMALQFLGGVQLVLGLVLLVEFEGPDSSLRSPVAEVWESSIVRLGGEMKRVQEEDLQVQLGFGQEQSSAGRNQRSER